MDDKKKFTSYSIDWKQSYSQYTNIVKAEDLREQILELQVERSDLSEANRVIERIKSIK